MQQADEFGMGDDAIRSLRRDEAHFSRCADQCRVFCADSHSPARRHLPLCPLSTPGCRLRRGGAESPESPRCTAHPKPVTRAKFTREVQKPLGIGVQSKQEKPCEARPLGGENWAADRTSARPSSSWATRSGICVPVLPKMTFRAGSPEPRRYRRNGRRERPEKIPPPMSTPAATTPTRAAPSSKNSPTEARIPISSTKRAMPMGPSRVI